MRESLWIANGKEPMVEIEAINPRLEARSRWKLQIGTIIIFDFKDYSSPLVDLDFKVEGNCIQSEQALILAGKILGPSTDHLEDTTQGHGLVDLRSHRRNGISND